MQSVLRAVKLTKRYGSFTAVDAIDLEVHEGEVFGILGPNGAGKTSTIRMTTCISPVDGGELLVDGLDVTQMPRTIKGILGVVQQEDNLDTDLNVMQNLLTHARYYGISRSEAQARAQEVLGLMELSDRTRDSVETLSGGMKRRLMIARALMNRPKILILDEPTTGLDPHARHLVWQRIRHLKREQVTMILSTHYMEEAAHLCDRVVIMDRGRVLAEGSPRSLVDRFAPDQVVEMRLEPWERESVLARIDRSAHTFTDTTEALIFFNTSGTVPDVGIAHDQLDVVRRPGCLEDVFLLLAGREAGRD